MNEVNLIGRLTKDVTLKYTQSGMAIAQSSIAVNRDFTNQNGERESDFINFVIWNKAAENFANFKAKGSQIGLSGRWQTRNYENQQGERVYVNELVVSNFDLLETKAETDARKASQQTNQAPPMPVAEDKLAEVMNMSESFESQTADQNGGLELTDDDLPF